MLSIILQLLFVYAACDATDYYEKRSAIIRNESAMSLGGNVALNDRETIVNNCLMQHKFKELNYAYDNPRYFNFSHHYFTYKTKIRDSKVFKIIKRMPKGAVLHIHDMSIQGPDYLMRITYMDNLYVCFDDAQIHFMFANKLPSGQCSRHWQLLSDLRKSVKNVTQFDAELRTNFTMIVPNPEEVYSCITDTWTRFMKYFQTVAPLLTYRPVWEQYYYDALTTLKNDNILYVEVRSVLPPLYELDGSVHSDIITAKTYKKITDRFVKNNPDFVGAKLIYAPLRHVNVDQLGLYIQTAKKIKQAIPDFFAGFDLVGQEDLGKPLVAFVPQLLDAAKDLDFFFHAGETDWYGASSDENLIDAILLGAKRLGHAYALGKHPLLVGEVMRKNIGLEVNVISNTVLSLVKDVRNHPLSIFLSNGLPVVLSSDDPGTWEADPLSDDFYVAFLAAASEHSDLKLLKTLAINSLKYSSLDINRKHVALTAFINEWNTFINNFNCAEY